MTNRLSLACSALAVCFGLSLVPVAQAAESSEHMSKMSDGMHKGGAMKEHKKHKDNMMKGDAMKKDDAAPAQ